MNRYELEHTEIPAQFFRSCREFMEEAESRGSDMFWGLYQQLEDSSQFKKEEFDAGLLEMDSDEVSICRVFVPGASRPAECAILYVLYNSDYEPLRYLTVEVLPEGGYGLLIWDSSLNYIMQGAFEWQHERQMLETVVEGILHPEEEFSTGRYGEMRGLLEKYHVPFYEDEVSDYIRMFDVIEELILGCLTREQIVSTFASMLDIMEDDELVTSRDKMRAMYEKMDELPDSKGKMDRKARLFFGFSVYAAHNVISENDDKKHHFMGLPEFQSADYIKYKMEEYWAMDPYMFTFAF